MLRIQRHVLTVLARLGVFATVALNACGDAGTPAAPAPSTGSFTLTAAPVTLEVMQGGEGEAKIGIVRTDGFKGNVTLAVSGVPAGLTATISPTTTSGNVATLVVTTQTSVPAGSVKLTITGTAADRADQTTATTLAIVPSTGSVGNVTLDFSACPASYRPIWFAFQDGAGRWREAIGSSDVYRFDVTSSKGGYAYVMQGSQREVQVSFATQSELVALTRDRCAGSQTKAVSGTLAGINAADVTYVGLGGGSTDPEGGPAAPNFTLTGVQNGSQDLIAYRNNPFASANARAIIRRDLNVVNNGSLSAIDFNAAESFVPGSSSLTVTGATSFGHFMSYLTGAGCSYASLYDQPNSGAQSTMRGIPVERQRATDFHSLTVYLDEPYRAASESFHTLANRIVAFPAALPTPAITSPPGGHKRLQVALTLPAEYQRSLLLFFFEPTQTGARGWVTASFAWLGGSAATLAFPDLSGATGWKSSFLPASNVSAAWVIAAYGDNSGGSLNACVENARFVSAYLNGRE